MTQIQYDIKDVDDYKIQPVEDIPLEDEDEGEYHDEDTEDGDDDSDIMEASIEDFSVNYGSDLDEEAEEGAGLDIPINEIEDSDGNDADIEEDAPEDEVDSDDDEDIEEEDYESAQDSPASPEGSPSRDRALEDQEEGIQYNHDLDRTIDVSDDSVPSQSGDESRDGHEDTADSEPQSPGSQPEEDDLFLESDEYIDDYQEGDEDSGGELD